MTTIASERTAAVATLAAVALVAFGPASAEPKTEMIVFGDSLSDNGNFFALNGGVYPPAPFYSAGRFSDGPVWWQYLAVDLGISSTNLAVAGAFTGDRNESDGAFTGDPVNEQYPGLADQVDGYLSSRPDGINPEALYVVWAGPNDLIEHLGLFIATGNPAFIDPVGPATNLATAIADLAAAGARYFMVPSMPNLSVVPRVQKFPPVLQAQVEGLSALYKGVIDATVATTADQLGVTLIAVDSFALLSGVTADPAAFGFSEVTMECLHRPDVLNPYTWTPCVAPGSEAPEGWFFWDDLHPTTQGHRLIGEEFAGEFRAQFCGLDPAYVTSGREDQEAPPLWRGVCNRAQ